MDLNSVIQTLDDPVLLCAWAVALDIVTRLITPFIRDRTGVLAGVPAAVARALKKKLNRPHRDPGSLAFRGGIVTIAIAALAYAAGYMIDDVIHYHKNGGAFAVLLIFSTMTVTRPWSMLTELIPIIRQNPTTAAKNSKALLARRGFHKELFKNVSDHYAVVRTATYLSISDVTRGFIFPLFWFLLPELFGYSGFITLIVAVSLSEAKKVITPDIRAIEPFGNLLELVDIVLYFVPARVGAIIILIASIFTPGASPLQALKTLVTQAHKHVGFNSGWPVAVTAGALNAAFDGGSGPKQEDRWIGPPQATAQLKWQDLRRALFLQIVTYLVTLLVIAVMIFNFLGYQDILI